MKIPVSWLREYVEVDATTRQIAERLAISTFERKRRWRHSATGDADTSAALNETRYAH